MRASSQCNCDPRAPLAEADLQRLKLKLNTVLFRELTGIDDGDWQARKVWYHFQTANVIGRRRLGVGRWRQSPSGDLSCPSGQVTDPVWRIYDICAPSFLVTSYMSPPYCRSLGSGTSRSASQAMFYHCHPCPPLGALGWKMTNLIKQTISSVFMLGS